MYREAKPWVVNREEKEIPPYILPELMTCQDGTPVRTPDDWYQKRRPELLRLFQKIMYGSPLPLPDETRISLLRERTARDGLAVRREILLDFRMKNGMRHSAVVLLYVPRKRVAAVPVCVSLTLSGNEGITEEDDVLMTGQAGNYGERFAAPGAHVHRYPIDFILQRGYALAVASYHDFFPDYQNTWDQSVYRLFRTPQELASRPENASAMAAWAWGFSRILDGLFSFPEINASQALCIGLSRLGKASLWAGVQDERFKLICVNDAGCGGPALSRRLYGETLYSMYEYTWFGRSWFTEEMEKYALHPETLPFDQHELIALAAPRAVAIHSATEDLWADPKGEFLGTFFAGPAFSLLGKEPLASEEMPAPGQSVGTDVSYFLRKGKHELLIEDWEHYLNAADRIFCRKESGR